METYEIKSENIDQNREDNNCFQTEIPLHIFQYLPFSSHGSQLQNLCRICLSAVKKTKVSLKSVYNNMTLIEILTSFTPIQVSINNYYK